jgi:hypothetical protein
LTDHSGATTDTFQYALYGELVVGSSFNFARGWVKIITVIGLFGFIILYILLSVTFLSPLLPKIFVKWKDNYAVATSKPARLRIIKSAFVFSPVVMTAFPSLVR